MSSNGEEKVAGAIRALEAGDTAVPLTQYNLRFSGGRPAVVMLPRGATDEELLEFVALVAGQVRSNATRERDGIESRLTLVRPG